MKVLDLFCGMGGWSNGFAKNGFECVGVDIVDVGYPYQLILQDVRTLDGRRFKDFDIIVGSPPCKDFSRMKRVWKTRKWSDPPDFNRGIDMVNAFLRIVDEAQPRYWLMENVKELRPHVRYEPQMIARLTPTMKRAFWGDFPSFLVPMMNRKPAMDIQGPLRAWERAEIPLPTADALAKAILHDFQLSDNII